MSKATGGTAYPAGQWHDLQSGKTHDRPGMTLRDYFAAKAMESMNGAHNGEDFLFGNEDIARMSYAVADAMLAERAK